MLVSCASLNHPTHVDVLKFRKDVELLIAQAKFDEAASQIGSHSDDKNWCVAFNSEGRCYSGAKESPIPELQELLTGSKQCWPAIQAGERDFTHRQEAEATLLSIEASCRSYSRDWVEKIRAANARLKPMTYSLPFGPKNADGSHDPLWQQRNKCLAGLRWSYETNKRQRKGAFATRVDCEAARVSDPAAKGGVYQFLETECRYLYQGGAISAPVYATSILNTGYTKEPFFFATLPGCQSALQTGITLPGANKARVVHSTASSETPKFIAQCTKDSLQICKRDDHGPSGVRVFQ